MTERLYYADAYQTRFCAKVVERLMHDGKLAVILDQTCFYPTGGGQPHDLGRIAGVPVVNVVVREADKAIIHVLADAVIVDEATCELDWARRFDFMQHHTGQHILTQAFVQTCGAQTVGFHLSADTVTIDLDQVTLSAAQIDSAEELANQIVYSARPVKTRILDPDAADGVRMRRLPDTLVTGGLRVVEVADFDVTACGGTHVQSTGEIGIIKVVKTEKRGDKLRVEFKCGGRALHDYRVKSDVLSRIANALNTHFSEADAVMAKLQEDYRSAARALKAALSQLVEYEAASLIAETASENGRRLIIRVYEQRDPAELKLLAQRLSAVDGVIALLGSAGDKALLIFARSADRTEDINSLLKRALRQLGDARGGGQPNMAQGGGVPADEVAIRRAIEDAAAQLG
ncbi:MAG: alanyl-tRNA editing protein [Phototrophicales bacterium]|nr:MAG: alanyl-tRNA editing protein [Phototrophicales bacterium]